ncbi:MAG: hypothetical protein K0R49_667 [Burkholderiales bacterium]|jgi:hypothetical protein|nr:hypothetical protein [Burkholderiales bacterium]
MKQNKYLCIFLLFFFSYYGMAYAEDEFGICMSFPVNSNYPDLIVNWENHNIPPVNSQSVINIAFTRLNREQLDLNHTQGISGLIREEINAYTLDRGRIKYIKIAGPLRNLHLHIDYDDNKVGKKLIGKISYDDVHERPAMCFIANTKEELKILLANNTDKSFCERYGKQLVGVTATAAALFMAYYCGV